MSQNYAEERKYLDDKNIVVPVGNEEVWHLKEALRDLVVQRAILLQQLEAKQARIDKLTGYSGRVNGSENLTQDVIDARVRRARSQANARTNRVGHDQGRVEQVGPDEGGGVHSVPGELGGVHQAGHDSFEAGAVL